MSDCFVLYLLLICMKKKKSGAGKFTNNSMRMNANILSLVVTGLAFLLALLSYRKVMKLADAFEKR